MRTVLCLLLLCSLTIGGTPVMASAASYEQYRKTTCEPGEKEVAARFTLDERTGEKIYDESTRYDGDKRYYKLTDYRDDQGGEVKYCQIMINETLNVISVIAVMVGALMGLLYMRSQDAN